MNLFKLFFILAVVSFIGAQPSPKFTISSSTSIGREPEPLNDCSLDGKQGNPGAQIQFSSSSLDSVYKHAMATIVKAIKEMTLPDVMVPLAGGYLSIKGARIVEAKLGSYQRELVPPHKNVEQGEIKSYFYGGRIVSIGEWTYRTINQQRRTMTGIFRTVVIDPELNTTNVFMRRWDGKPMMETRYCLATLEKFRVEIEGFGDNTTVIEQCNNILCTKIREYFQDQTCKRARTYVEDFVNRKLGTLQTKIRLGPISSGNRFVLDYSLMTGDPKVFKKTVQGFMEGEVLARGAMGVPFNAPTLISFDDEGDFKEDNKGQSMMSFKLSDYAFNTLFHHAHAQQFKFSAFDLIPASSPVRNYLKMRCPSSSVRSSVGKPKQASPPVKPSASPSTCLGAVFEKNTSSSSDEANRDGLGDLVFKSQRPMQVILQDSPHLFGIDGGMIEAYGASGNDGRRELLGRADVQWIRGVFSPKLDGCNITGSIIVNTVNLTSSTSTPAIARFRSMSESMLNKLSQLSVPIFTEMIRSFVDEYAQFPIPMFDGLECESPKMVFANNRTMLVRTDIRSTPDSKKKP